VETVEKRLVVVDGVLNEWVVNVLRVFFEDIQDKKILLLWFGIFKVNIKEHASGLDYSR